MAVYKQAKSKNWWYKFTWNGEPIRESTKQTNKRVAEQMEAAHRTSLAKGEVGIREKKRVPTLREFADERFLPFVRATKAEKPRTIVFYETTVNNLKSFGKLADLPLDRITSEMLGEFAAMRQRKDMKVSTINRELATVRRIFNLAQEWGHVSSVLPRVRLNPGEESRKRVLTSGEEDAYLAAAREIGRVQERAYAAALKGIRATIRGRQPIRPDAYLLYDVAVILLDCGFRPDECYRLQWRQIRDGGIDIQTGKGEGSRRRVPCTSRVKAVLDMRRAATNLREATVSQSDAQVGEQGIDPLWVFPRNTMSGHIEGSTINEQHNIARRSAYLPEVVIYDFRHTRITRWAKVLPLPVVQRLAGHKSIATTMRYVHISDDDVRAAMAREQEEKSGHTSRHTDSNHPSANGSKTL